MEKEIEVRQEGREGRHGIRKAEEGKMKEGKDEEKHRGNEERKGVRTRRNRLRRGEELGEAGNEEVEEEEVNINERRKQ